MMFKFPRVAAAGLVVAALTLTGCAGAGNDDTSEPETLTIGAILPPVTFAAADMNFGPESLYGQAVYDTLVVADTENNILPNLATDWSYNEDNTVLTMNLRDDVTFTDGEKFTADAAAQNLLRFRDGSSQNRSLLAAVQDAVAIDDTTLQITLTGPDPALVFSLTQNAGAVESPAAFDNEDIQTIPVGSGPYVLNSDKTVVGSEYVFDANPDYWNPDNQHFDEFVLKVIPDPNASMNALISGEIDGMIASPDQYDPITNAGNIDLVPSELNWQGLTLLDRAGQMNPALGDVRVRQAINYAFDPQTMLDALNYGAGTTTSQVFPSYSEAFDPELDSYYSQDLDKARELLTEAGYPDGFTLNLPTASFHPPAWYSLVSEQLSEIGITVELTDTGNNFFSDVLTPKYPAFLNGLQQDPVDWLVINFSISQDAAWNPFHYTDPTVESLIETYQYGSDAERTEAVRELNRYIVEQAWFAVWFTSELSFAINDEYTATAQPGNIYPYLSSILPK